MALSIGLGTQRGNGDVRDTQPYALLVIANEQDIQKDRAGAVQTLRIALKTIDDDPKMRGRDGRYEQVGSFLARFGAIASARSALDKMQMHQRDLLTCIARAERARGNETTARADFAKAVELTRAELAGMMRSTAQATIVEEAARADLNSGEANQLVFNLAALAGVQAEAGDYADAKTTIEAARAVKDPLKQGDLSAAVYASVTTGWAMSGDLAGAISLALDTDKATTKRAALRGVAVGYRTWKLK
jgi:tetratricopeptide (TPR) repeat protein